MTTPISSDPHQQRWVPVVSKTGKPLMPCHPARARKLIAKGKATPHYKSRLFYIVLTEREDGDTQPIALGIDPGSKMEGYTLKSEKRTLLNIQSHAADGKGISKAVETRANARGARRQRKTPCRACRPNRARKQDWLPPSTHARWQLKYNIFAWLANLYPVECVVIEDVKAKTVKGQHAGAKRWNNNFSPIEAGKHWLYRRLQAYGVELVKVEGHQTYEMRQAMGLPKTKSKLATIFSAHCVDSWTLANAWVGGHTTPDLEALLVLKQLPVIRRQLTLFNPSQGGERRRYGGSLSLGIQKGTLAIHPKYGQCLVGGHDGQGRLSLNAPVSNSRLCQNAKPTDLTLVSHSPWSLYDHAAAHRTQKKAMRRQHSLLRRGQVHLLSSSPP